MKNLKSLPKQNKYFARYARLANSIRLSGYFSQGVSGLTEIGGIFAAALSILYPIFPSLAFYIAAVIAVIGTLVLEAGLRIAVPQSVDAILYKRWSGPDLAMSISVLILSLILLATSGVLS